MGVCARVLVFPLVLSPLAAASCATDEAPPPARLGAQPVPVEAAQQAPAMAADDAGAERSAARPRVSRAFIYNRVLAKLEDPAAVDMAALERTLEARTGAEVKEIKRGPMGLLSIIFEETDPPRGAEEQKALIESLAGTPQLRYVEPERLLEAK